jgi:hypothetical protein
MRSGDYDCGVMKTNSVLFKVLEKELARWLYQCMAIEDWECDESALQLN